MSVAVVHKQAVILARGFGIVDLAKGTAATENTPYPIASLTKTFAAAVIMRLVEAGKLDLDEAMSTYDPGYAQWCARVKSSNLAVARTYNCDSERITFATTSRIPLKASPEPTTSIMDSSSRASRPWSTHCPPRDLIVRSKKTSSSRWA